MKYVCIPMIGFRSVILLAATVLCGVGPGRALAATIIVLELSEQGDTESCNTISEADDWQPGSVSPSYGYDWSKLSHSPDEYFKKALASSLGKTDESADDSYADVSNGLAGTPMSYAHGLETSEDEVSTEGITAIAVQESNAMASTDTDHSYSAAIEADADNLTGGPEKAFSRYHYAVPDDRYGGYPSVEALGEDESVSDYASNQDEGRGTTDGMTSVDDDDDEYADAADRTSMGEYADETTDTPSHEEPSLGFEAAIPQAMYGSMADAQEDQSDDSSMGSEGDQAQSESDEQAPWVIENPADASADEKTDESMYDDQTPESMDPSASNPYSYDYSTIREKYAYVVEEGQKASDEMDGVSEKDSSTAMDDEDESADEDGMEESEENLESMTDSSATAGAGQVRESGVELFAWLPSELLLLPDQELIKSLERLGEGEWEARRQALQDYVQSLGSEAQQFAAMCEATANTEVGSLADDSVDAAAFLASYRLYEQGELGMAEAADLLRRSLHNLPQEWVEGVEQMADRESSDPESQQVTAAESLWRWIATRAGDSVRQMNAVAGSVWFDPVPASVWKQILAGRSVLEGAKAYHTESMNDWFQR